MRLLITLLQKVFSEVDSKLYDEMHGEKNQAKIQFLKLLQYLRKVLIQDACFLIDKYPNHILWQHEVFQCEEFISFKTELIDLVANLENPNDISLVQALPPAFDKLSAEVKELSMQIKKLEHQLTRKMELISNVTSEAFRKKRKRVFLLKK